MAAERPDDVTASHERTLRLWEQADGSDTERVVRHYDLGGAVARFDVVGPGLADAVHEALRHLETEPATEDLRVQLWHTAECGVGADPFSDTIDPAHRHPLRASSDDRVVLHRQHQTAAWLDRRERRILGSVGSCDERSVYESGRPLELLLTFWARDQGGLVVHSAAVARDGVAALLVGKTGSGKSTLAAGCLADGLDFLNDDKVVLTGDQRGWIAHGLNSSLNLTQESLDRLPTLTGSVLTSPLPADDKHRIRVGDGLRDRLRAQARVGCVIAPRVGPDRVTTHGEISPAAALRALAVSTLTAMPTSMEDGLDRLGDLAESVPAFEVRLGEDGRGPATVASILAEVADG